MPEHIAELTEKERKRLERLGIMLGYKDSEQLANNVLKDILAGRLKVTRPTLKKWIVDFIIGEGR